MKKYLAWKLNASKKESFQSNYYLRNLPNDSLLLGECEEKRITTSLKNLMIIGEVGSGKTTLIQTILTSLFYGRFSKEFQVILIDVKKDDLYQFFQALPHLACPILNEAKLAIDALLWLNDEMKRRRKLFSSLNIQHFKEYQTLEDSSEKLPILLLVIDEYLDILDLYPNAFKKTIIRLIQFGESLGIYTILSTCIPTKESLFETLKARIPNRIIFKSNSNTESSFSFLERKDLYYLEGKAFKHFYSIRFEEKFMKKHFKAIDEFSYLIPIESLKQYEGDKREQYEDLLYRVGYFCVKNNCVNTSTIQLVFTLGFAKTNKIMENLEQRTILSSKDGLKERNILVDIKTLQKIFHK